MIPKLWTIHLFQDLSEDSSQISVETVVKSKHIFLTDKSLGTYLSITVSWVMKWSLDFTKVLARILHLLFKVSSQLTCAFSLTGTCTGSNPLCQGFFALLSLTLGADMQRGLQYLVCVSACVCLLLDISLLEWLFTPQTNSPIQRWMKILSCFLGECLIWKNENAVRLMQK